ncbi:hypothetical protein HOM50_00255 [bacterium]|jgi:hypothetical protein|nr:hypothetical protein [bacterium]MBT5014828.1 hypothetical protein [bacterium]
MKLDKLIYLIISLLIIGYISWSFFYPVGESLLPEPSGRFKVGQTELYLTDSSRQERDSIGHRQLKLQIFYPAEAIRGERSPYIEKAALDIVKQDLSKFSGLPIEQFNYLGSLQSHSFISAPIATDSKTYPVIIFSPGWGMPVSLYFSLLGDLASHGYIVVGIQYPYVTNPVLFPDGRIIKGLQNSDAEQKQKELQIWVKDISFVIDELDRFNHSDLDNPLKGRLAMLRIGLLGHSFGGSVSIEACQQDWRCRSVVDIEGKLYQTTESDKPVLFIVAPHSVEVLQPIKDITKTSKSISYIELEGAKHGSFTDLYFIVKFDKDKLPSLEVLKGIQQTRGLLLGFFNEYLVDKLGPNLMEQK